jgi:hypothetical protein
MAFGSQDIHTCVLLLSREANLNALNNVGQTPIAFGTPDLLTSLGVFNGVAYSTKGSAVPLAVDNNKLWKMKKQATPMIERIAMNDLVERYHMLMKDKPSPEPSTDLHEQPEGQS